MILKSKRYLDFIVYEDGDVYSFKHRRLLKPMGESNRYLQVCIKHKPELVHRLVAKLFVPNSFNKPCVNHKDGNRTNNHYSNLEWVTGQENMTHAVKLGLIKAGSKHPRAKKISQWSLDKCFIKKWDYINQAAKTLDINKSSIIACCQNKRNKAGGFMWTYETKRED